MRLHNTLTRRDEDFVPADGRTVRMYTCGLTVYARGHIGNFRSFVSLDVLRRALRHQEGYAMRHVMNFTDVDDKTIKASHEAGVSLLRAHGQPPGGSTRSNVARPPNPSSKLVNSFSAWLCHGK